MRWRVAVGVTRESHVVPLPDHHVLGLASVDDGGGHHHLHVPGPVHHGVGVDLTHVPPPVALLGAVEVEVPLVLS